MESANRADCLLLDDQKIRVPNLSGTLSCSQGSAIKNHYLLRGGCSGATWVGAARRRAHTAGAAFAFATAGIGDHVHAGDVKGFLCARRASGGGGGINAGSCTCTALPSAFDRDFMAD